MDIELDIEMLLNEDYNPTEGLYSYDESTGKYICEDADEEDLLMLEMLND